MADLAEELRSRAWEHRHHRKYRAVAADEIEQLRRERDEARLRAKAWEAAAKKDKTLALASEARVVALRAEISWLLGRYQSQTPTDAGRRQMLHLFARILAADPAGK